MSAAEFGKYTAVAYNSVGETRCSCQLEQEPQEAFRVPSFSRQLVDRYFISGQKAILEVIAEGNPPPEFKWEKDSLDIRPESDPHYILSSSTTSGRATLTIPVVTRNDAGLYSVVAHNSVGRDRCSCLIYVDGSGVKQGKTSATNSAAGTSVFETDALPPQPPSKSQPSMGKIEIVTSLPKSVEISEGEELRLLAVVKSDIHLIRKFPQPLPLFFSVYFCVGKDNTFPSLYPATWTKAGRTLTFDGRRRITRNLMGEMCLTIDQAMLTDAGRYTLTVAPSDPTVAEIIEPVVLNTRVDVNPKTRSRVR